MWIDGSEEKSKAMFSQVAKIALMGRDPISTVAAAHLLPISSLTWRSQAGTWVRGGCSVLWGLPKLARARTIRSASVHGHRSGDGVVGTMPHLGFGRALCLEGRERHKATVCAKLQSLSHPAWHHPNLCAPCPGFRWGRVNFLPSCLYGAVLWI